MWCLQDVISGFKQEWAGWTKIGCEWLIDLVVASHNQSEIHTLEKSADFGLEIRDSRWMKLQFILLIELLAEPYIYYYLLLY